MPSKEVGSSPIELTKIAQPRSRFLKLKKKIEQADVCFADITTDNPNVWCEVGLAIAHRKELCLVCAKGRKLPFDVQHRQVIFYSTNAPSDFDELKIAIERRLEAIAKKLSELSLIPKAIAKAESTQSELTNFEVAVIGVLASELSLEEESLSIGYLRQAVDKQGYTSIAANTGARLLLKKNYISSSLEQDRDGDEYTAISLTTVGWDWIENNIEKFQLKKQEPFGRKGRMNDVIGDDIPF